MLTGHLEVGENDSVTTFLGPWVEGVPASGPGES